MRRQRRVGRKHLLYQRVFVDHDRVLPEHWNRFCTEIDGRFRRTEPEESQDRPAAHQLLGESLTAKCDIADSVAVSVIAGIITPEVPTAVLRPLDLTGGSSAQNGNLLLVVHEAVFRKEGVVRRRQQTDPDIVVRKEVAPKCVRHQG